MVLSSYMNPDQRKLEELQWRKKNDVSGDWAWGKEFAGITMASNYYTFHLMSKIMSANPQLRGIVELGTYTGSMSIYLGLEGIRKGIEVVTFDIIDLLSLESRTILDTLKVQRVVCNLFDPEVQRHMRMMLSRFPVYLIVDNGDKPREFKEFVPMLRAESIISVHDYGIEFSDADWMVHKDKVEPYLKDEWAAHNVQLASFKMKV